MTDWIKYDGKGMPVDSETRVDVEFFNGINEYHVRAGLWGWGWPKECLPYNYHIKSYRVSVND